MRNIYIAVTAFFILSVTLFISSFIVLDKEKHKVWHYTVSQDGRAIGNIKADRFKTEDKLIYKSVSSTPFAPLFTESKERIELDPDYTLQGYSRERRANGAGDETYIEKRKDTVSYLSKFESRLAYLPDMPVRKGTFIFEEASPVTYLPILENYDFKKGRSQGFNAITIFNKPGLPPIKRFVTLTSIRDEYLQIGPRRVKTENLVLKIKNYPVGGLWVAKSDRSLVRIELPDRGITITRAIAPAGLEAKRYAYSSDDYTSRDAVFSNKKVQLSGTLSVPKGDGKYPAVLLIWDRGPQDRNYQGFFACISDYLAKRGFSVLRFDKRGIGESGGDASLTTESTETEDIKAAVGYLAAQKEVDIGRISLIAHGRGAYLALLVASEYDGIRSLVLMAPSVFPESDVNLRALKEAASPYKWSDEYIDLAVKMAEDTDRRARDARHDWAYILGRLCFVKGLKEELSDKPMDVAAKVKKPVLIMHGKKDEGIPMEFAGSLDKAIGDGGNQDHTLAYFSYLGHFFGKKISDGTHKIYYEVDPEVLDNMKKWLDKNAIEEVVRTPEPAAADPAASPTEDAGKKI